MAADTAANTPVIKNLSLTQRDCDAVVVNDHAPPLLLKTCP